MGMLNVSIQGAITPDFNIPTPSKFDLIGIIAYSPVVQFNEKLTNPTKINLCIFVISHNPVTLKEFSSQLFPPFYMLWLVYLQ